MPRDYQPRRWRAYLRLADTMTINANQASRFLSLLALDPAEPQTWQVFRDRTDATCQPEHRHCTLAAALPWMERSQQAGGGVFWTVQQTDGKGRRAANVTRIRHLFVDCDQGLPERWHVEPACVVESSPGKQHAYWVLADAPGTVDAQTFTDAQRRLIAHYGSDPSCKDLPRVLRLPGTTHQKGKPFEVRVVYESPWGIYRLADVLDGIAPLPVVAVPDAQAIAARAAQVRGGMVQAIDVATLDLVSLFRDAGLLLDTQRNGGHAVTCPWASEHTSETSPTAAMVWNGGAGALPGYKCLHGHCAGRGLADVMRLFARQLDGYAQTTMKPHKAIEKAQLLRQGDRA